MAGAQVVLAILFGAAFTVAVSLALGMLLLQRLAPRLYREEEYLLGFVAGSACLSTAIFLLCAVRAARPEILLGLGIVVILAAVLRGAFRTSGEPLPALSLRWRWLFFTVYLAFGLLYFVHAMAPESSPDGAGYHLGLVARYLRAGGFERITTNMYANLSQGIEMLYLFAFAFGKHSAASMVHLAFLLTLPLLVLCYARRRGWPEAGVCAAILVFASPVFGRDGTTAYNDVAVGTVVFAAFYLIEIWSESKDDLRLLALAGLLAGFCYAAKYTAGIAIFYALGRSGLRWRRWLPILACAAIVAGPWMLKNWMWLDNPFSPFLNRMFPNPYIHISFEQEYAHHMRNYDILRSHWEIPLEVTVRGTALVGLLGPAFLLFPIGCFASRRLLVAALIFGSAYAFNIGTRFLIPAAPFLALLISLALARWRWALAGLAVAHAVVSWPWMLDLYSAPGSWHLRGIPVNGALRIEQEDSYLRKNLPNYGAARLIERLTPPGAKVFTFTQVPDAYTSREILVAYQSASNQVLGDILWKPMMEQSMPIRTVSFRFPARSVREIKIIQAKDGGGGEWIVTEVHFFHQGQRILPAAWSTTPNSWDAGLAFDGLSVTHWRSWEPARRGMTLRASFDTRRIVDEVEIQTPRDQTPNRMSLDGIASEGVDTPIPLPNLRREVGGAFKSRGVEYMLVYDFDYGAIDYRPRSEEWRLELLGSDGPARLYRWR